MKKLLVAVVAVAMAFFGATTAMAGIAGSKHDLSTSTAGGTNEICVFCHTPHGGDQTQGPLWNRTGATTNYTLYTFTTSTSANPAASDLSNGSKACLTCHDGITAIGGALINGPGNPDTAITVVNYSGNYMTGMSNIGGGTGGAGNTSDLSNDHPVGVTYDTAHALNALDGSALQTVVVSATGVVMGTNGTSKVQCESCHEPHDNANGTFLRYSNASSQLCLACHNK